MRTPLSLGVVGLGGRGATLVRAFDELASAEVRWLYDHSPAAVMRTWRRVSYARVAGGFEDMLEDETLDAVVIATPPPTRAALARRALAAGKHVLVEPPLALEAPEAEDLVCLAESGDRRLVASHATQFHPAARRLAALIAGGGLGQVHYLYGSHEGFGRGEETVLWGPGAEAVSTLLWVLGDEPVEALARGARARAPAARTSRSATWGSPPGSRPSCGCRACSRRRPGSSPWSARAGRPASTRSTPCAR
jgi:predicted dehydrogenase